MIYGNYRTRSFNEIYEELVDFTTDFGYYSEAGLDPSFTGESTIDTLFYLLCAKYGNSHIANSDEDQFKLKLFSIVFQYGPTWEKRLSLQTSLRGLSDNDLLIGSTQINNHSYNPSTAPGTSTLEEFTTTNEQTAIKYKKSKMDAYANLMALLEKDVTDEFLTKFKSLFRIIVEPEFPLWYVTETEEEEV